MIDRNREKQTMVETRTNGEAANGTGARPVEQNRNASGETGAENRQYGNQSYSYGTNPYGNNSPYGTKGYAYAPRNANHEQITIASGANLLLGLWLLAAPFVLSYASANARGNDIVMGLIIGTLAAIRVFGAYRSAWISWVNALAGVWLIVAPFALGYSGLAHPTWNDVIVGILVLVFGVWSALATQGTTNNPMQRS